MDQVTLKAVPRTLGTKGAVNSMRRDGRIPGVVYGRGVENLSVEVEEKELLAVTHAARGGNMLINLQVAGVGDRTVLVKALQKDVISRRPLHVDFHQVSLKEKIEVTVPLQVTGESPSVKQGAGVLEQIIRTVKVRCLPTAIPAHIPVEVGALTLGGSILVKDLPVPPGGEIMSEPGQVVVNVVAPTVLEEPTAAAAPAVTEPELISKGKKVEEAETAAAGKPAPAGAGAKPAAPAGSPKVEKPKTS